MADRPVSPTHFHNSVHNAAAGYWAIAADCRKSSVSLSAYGDTFAAGLVEAISMVHVEQAAVLLVAYDAPGPATFQGHRPVTEAFAAALVLAPEKVGPSVAELAITFAPFPYSPPPLSDPGLQHLRSANPAARCLPLLTALAGSDNGFVQLSEAVSLALHVHSLEEEAM
jgi:hypothetical protein